MDWAAKSIQDWKDPMNLTFEQGMAFFCAVVCMYAAWQILGGVRLDARKEAMKDLHKAVRDDREGVKKVYFPEKDTHNPLK